MSAAAGLRAPALGRRLASALYDLLLLGALILIATFPFLAAVGDATTGWRRHLLQLWVLGVAAAYFAWFWTHGGQTLPMKTWRLRLVRGDGAPVSTLRALHRYLLALLGLLNDWPALLSAGMPVVIVALAATVGLRVAERR